LAGALDLYPQEITRALLNLISNGFYAATRRKVEGGDGTFEPVCGVDMAFIPISLDRYGG
jgi:hypothetical protein